MTHTGDILLLALALIGGGWDLMTKRIPNWLTFPAAAAGLVWNGYSGGARGALLAFGGLACGLAMVVLGMGMGDVKMMAAAGAIASLKGLLVIFVYTGLLGGLAGLLLAASRGRLWATLANTGRLIGFLGRGKLELARQLEPAAGRLRYGAVIAGGCAIYLWIGPKSI